MGVKGKKTSWSKRLVDLCVLRSLNHWYVSFSPATWACGISRSNAISGF